MTMDFSGAAGAGSDFDLLPKNFLCWAYLNLRGVKASGSGGGYLDVELTVAENQPFAGRKLWDMIGDPNNAGNSEKYRQMGQIAICRILEAGRNAGPNNPAGYQIANYEQLSGLKVAIKVGVEPGTDGHDDKNRVADFLTPNPQSGSHKLFQKLIAGDHQLASAPAGGGASGGFGFGGTTAPAATASAAGNGGFTFGGANAPSAPGGAASSGFSQPQQEGVADPAASQSGQAQTQQPPGNATTASSPSDPAAAPGWLAQAGGQATQ